jgi:hypothetical protein
MTITGQYNSLIVSSTFRTLIVFLLAFVLALQLPAQRNSMNDDLAQRIRALSTGNRIDLRTTDGQRIQGLLITTTVDSLTISIGRQNTASRRVILLHDVVALKVRHPAHTPVAAWIVAGCLGAAVVLALSVFLIERHNEGK